MSYSCFGGFCRSSPIAPPKVISDITSIEVANILSFCKQVVMSDSNYELYKREDYERFLSADLTNRRKYVKESNDCDDFAKVLLGEQIKWTSVNETHRSSVFGIAYGIIKGNSHAVNFFIDDNKKIWYVEPQTDEIFTLSSEDSIYWMYL